MPTSYTQKKCLIVILGPTAVGKTALCTMLAHDLGTEIVSADSRQCYQKMDIGTAKPTDEEQAMAKHHLVDFLSIDSGYSAGQYQRDALAMLHTIWKDKPYAILTGGSGLYIDAVCQGIPIMPEIPASISKDLEATYEKEGLAALWAELRDKDPDYYQEVDLHNAKRVMRALAVCRATQKTFSFFRARAVAKRDFNIVKIGLMRPREVLYDRINKRVDLMLLQGLWEEASRLYDYRHLPALATIGYQEIFPCLDGVYDDSYAIARIKQNSRRYAKRQITYFKKDPSIHWFHPEALEAIKAFILERLNTHKAQSLLA